jgi:hypothetical protein
VRERPVFTRQARDSARVQADLRPCPVFTTVAVGDTKAKRDIMETAELSEVIADLIYLLLAPLRFDVVGWQRR